MEKYTAAAPIPIKTTKKDMNSFLLIDVGFWAHRTHAYTSNTAMSFYPMIPIPCMDHWRIQGGALPPPKRNFLTKAFFYLFPLFLISIETILINRLRYSTRIYYVLINRHPGKRLGRDMINSMNSRAHICCSRTTAAAMTIYSLLVSIFKNHSI